VCVWLAKVIIAVPFIFINQWCSNWNDCCPIFMYGLSILWIVFIFCFELVLLYCLFFDSNCFYLFIFLFVFIDFYIILIWWMTYPHCMHLLQRNKWGSTYILQSMLMSRNSKMLVVDASTVCVLSVFLFFNWLWL
jgi:hypothetical protein